MQEGAGYINMNIAADGTRVSATRAFLRPNLSRPNLTLLTNTPVTRLTFIGTRCSGVELLIDSQHHKVGASREVILSAGGVGSAKLLMLSGVGDAAELRSLGIAPVADLKGVGRSYHDHVLLSGVAFEYKGKMPDRAPDSNAVEAEAYLSSSVDNGGVIGAGTQGMSWVGLDDVLGVLYHAMYDRSLAGAMGPLTYGRAMREMTSAQLPASRGGRLDVKI
jgi:choline dehydrogenase